MATGTPVRPGLDMSDGAQNKTQEALDHGQEKVHEAASQAKSKVREQLDQRSTQAADQIDQQASDLRAVSQSLREQGKSGPAGAADKIAGSAERVGSYLREKDSDALLADVEDFARRQPWAVGAGALVLGFVGSRFLKASSGRRYSARYGQASAPEPSNAQTAVTPAPYEPTPVGATPRVRP